MAYWTLKKLKGSKWCMKRRRTAASPGSMYALWNPTISNLFNPLIQLIRDADNEREGSGRLDNKVETNLAPVEEVHKVYEPFDCEHFLSFCSSYGLKPSEAETLLPEWHQYSLHPQLLRRLHTKHFLSPTPIQSASLPIALAGRDVVGVAQTVRLIHIFLFTRC